jgi:hypothetical protein
MEKLDPGDNQNSEQERILEILDYWHKIEFFVPFDLEKMIDDSLGWQVIWLHKDDLKNEASAFWSHRIPGDHVLNRVCTLLGNIRQKRRFSSVGTVSQDSNRPDQ